MVNDISTKYRCIFEHLFERNRWLWRWDVNLTFSWLVMLVNSTLEHLLNIKQKIKYSRKLNTYKRGRIV